MSASVPEQEASCHRSANARALGRVEAATSTIRHRLDSERARAKSAAMAPVPMTPQLNCRFTRVAPRQVASEAPARKPRRRARGRCAKAKRREGLILEPRASAWGRFSQSTKANLDQRPECADRP